MQIGQLAFQYSPHQAMVDFGITVNQDIAERDDAAMFADRRGRVGIYPGQLVECFADDFELAFDSRAQKRIGCEFRERFTP